MKIIKVVSSIDIDSVDAFAPCALDPAPDPTWPSKKRQHADAAYRVLTDEGVKHLCYTCTYPPDTRPRTVTLPDGRIVVADKDGKPLWLADGGWYD